VVKKPIYAKLAKLCTESFLFYNPGCKVVINVDSSTEEAVKKALKKVAARKDVLIRNIGQSESTWQDIKLDLILNMRLQNEFFMDADLRWNGPIPHLSGITFFVNEFTFSTIDPYPRLLETCGWKASRAITMKNTSFLYWGGYEPSQQDKSFIEDTMAKIRQVCCDGLIQDEYAESMIRISEQIALSVLVDVNNQDVNYLKSKDGYRDGSFVESSYFGATGSAF
jgi:hypothetical protein